MSNMYLLKNCCLDNITNNNVWFYITGSQDQHLKNFCLWNRLPTIVTPSVQVQRELALKWTRNIFKDCFHILNCIWYFGIIWITLSLKKFDFIINRLRLAVRKLQAFSSRSTGSWSTVFISLPMTVANVARFKAINLGLFPIVWYPWHSICVLSL